MADHFAVPPKVLLFDLDDTLIVEKESAEKSFIETSKLVEETYEIDASEFSNTIRQQARKLWYSLPTIDYCLKIGISSWEGLWACFEGVHEQLKLLSDLAEFYQINSWNNALLEYQIDNKILASELAETYKMKRKEKHVLFSDSLDTLRFLFNKFRLGIITNGSPDLQWLKIKGGRIEKYFEHIVISGEVDYGKPDERIFKLALQKFNVDKNDAIMIGDNLSTDIIGAQGCGIKAIWLNRTGKAVEEGDILPDYTIHDLLELKMFLINFKA